MNIRLHSTPSRGSLIRPFEDGFFALRGRAAERQLLIEQENEMNEFLTFTGEYVMRR